ncbi:hypothetical protein SRB5_57180 [Streptomyces sp. RB5]|uniref:Uncharacterized protein n=1 Tax=Streptomyces smaragdinus TaxID=2585196 RepID=A0A7K0CPX3_9ACTN|nr:hypothetical protein [Streptomyces smaragdinus]MQY15536.1 hypothetical protein [Streptomyces smaragdinus]
MAGDCCSPNGTCHTSDAPTVEVVADETPEAKPELVGSTAPDAG